MDDQVAVRVVDGGRHRGEERSGARCPAAARRSRRRCARRRRAPSPGRAGRRRSAPPSSRRAMFGWSRPARIWRSSRKRWRARSESARFGHQLDRDRLAVGVVGAHRAQHDAACRRGPARPRPGRGRCGARRPAPRPPPACRPPSPRGSHHPPRARARRAAPGPPVGARRLRRRRVSSAVPRSACRGRERVRDQLLETRVALRSHGGQAVVARRWKSQARAVAHSRSTVALEIPRANAASSIERPPKKRISTTRAARGSSACQLVEGAVQRQQVQVARGRGRDRARRA